MNLLVKLSVVPIFFLPLMASVLWFVAKCSIDAPKSFFFCVTHSKKRASKNAVNNWQITRIEQNGSAPLDEGIIPIKSIDRPICKQKTGNMLRPINENG